MTALKLLATSCKFGEFMDDMIKDRIVITLEHVERDFFERPMRKLLYQPS